MTQPLLPSGLADLLPPDAAREQGMITALLACFASWGYEQVTPPLVEFEETLLSGKGKAYEAQTFRIMDPDSRRMMGVRADITTQVARIAASRMHHLPMPLRLSYAGRVLRAKPQGLLPDRQLVQSGIEIVGAKSPEAMTEVVSLCLEALARLGCDRIVLDLTMAGLLELIMQGAGETARLESIAAAAKRKDASALPPDLACRDLLLRLLKLSGTAEAVLTELATLSLPYPASLWVEGAKTFAARLRNDFPAIEINLDPLESHGFEYQEGVCFSLFDSVHGRELGRGGGYVIPREDGDPLIACGATLYIRRLMEGGYQPFIPAARVFLPLGTLEAEARRLRQEGYATLRAHVESDTPESLHCAHIYERGTLRPIQL